MQSCPNVHAAGVKLDLHRVNVDAPAEDLVNLLVNPAFEFLEASSGSWAPEDLEAEVAEFVLLWARSVTRLDTITREVGRTV